MDSKTVTDNDDFLPFYVVYDHPSDLPEWFVVRIQWPQRDGSVRFAAEAMLFQDLDAARGCLQEMGLACIPRDFRDDPVIIESWV